MTTEQVRVWLTDYAAMLQRLISDPKVGGAEWEAANQRFTEVTTYLKRTAVEPPAPLQEILSITTRGGSALERINEIYVIARDALHRQAGPNCDVARLHTACQTVMARLADLLDSDQFNNIEAIMLAAGVPYPPENRTGDA